jgi:hypothetical protein
MLPRNHEPSPDCAPVRDLMGGRAKKFADAKMQISLRRVRTQICGCPQKSCGYI